MNDSNEKTSEANIIGIYTLKKFKQTTEFDIKNLI